MSKRMGWGGNLKSAESQQLATSLGLEKGQLRFPPGKEEEPPAEWRQMYPGIPCRVGLIWGNGS